MEKERVLLLAGNYYPELTGIGKYNGEMLKWLSKQGHFCTVVTTFPYYPQWKIQEPYAKKCFWFKTEIQSVEGGEPIKIIRCPHYIPTNPSAIKRLISEFSFFLSAYLVLLTLLFKKKFDYLIAVAPPFEIGLLGIFYKVVKGCKFIYHIQDLQIDAARDLILIKSKIFIHFFLWIEKFILKYADWISTISIGMQEKVFLKCNKEVLLFPNWVDTNTFSPIKNKVILKLSYGFKSSDTVILYSGAIGNKQGLEAILHAANTLHYLPHLKFVICGTGPYTNNLIKLKQQLNLSNVTFMPLQPIENFNLFLNMADIHLVIQKKDGGDLFLPSKLCAILSVGGVAIVTAIKNTSLYNIIKSKNTGIVIDPEDNIALVDAILSKEDNQFKLMSKNARFYAERHLSANKILGDFFEKIFKKEIIPIIFIKDILGKTA